MDLILGMGAEHAKPHKLHEIINQINEDIISNISSISPNARDYLKDVYNITISNDYSRHRYVIEEKFDGFSYLNQNGEFYSKRLSTAKGNEGQPVCKSDSIHITPILRAVYKDCGANLHGELYIPGKISDDVNSILACTPELAMKKTMDACPHDRLHYMLIDIREYQGVSLLTEPYWVRRAILEYVYETFIMPRQQFIGNYYIVLPPVLNGSAEYNFSQIVNAGGEGIIIKRTNGLYIPGKKPANNWIKGKKKITHDVFILGFNQGTGKNEKYFGSIKFGHYIDDKIVACGNCSSGIEDDMRKYIYDNADKMIADKQVFEIEAIQESIKSFRNPVFLRLRDDKDHIDCKPTNIRVNCSLI